MALTKVGKEGITGITNASDATAITISSSENVGIGTASPTFTLDVYKSAVGDVFRLNSTSGNRSLNVSSADNGDFLGAKWTRDINSAGGIHCWSANGTESMRLAANGRQTFNGSSTANGHGNFVGEVGSSSKAIMFEHTNGGGETGSITTGSSSAAYNTSSDYRLKENVDYTWDATTRLKQLKPARFNFIIDADKTVDGFLAHEVSSIVPAAISGEKDAVDSNGKPEHQVIDHSKLVPLLVKTIQELEARLTAGGL